MIQEDYVGFENGKLLKEKGFNEPCNHFYNYQGKFTKTLLRNNIDLNFFSDLKDRYSAPTQALVLKWLRIKYNIHIEIVPNWTYQGKYNGWWWKIWFLETGRCGGQCHREGELTADKATEAAIKYVLLNLIK